MEDLKARIANIKQKLNPDKLKAEIKQIEAESGKPEFWQDQQKAAEKMKKMADLQKRSRRLRSWKIFLTRKNFQSLRENFKKLS